MSRPLRIQYPGAWYHVMNRARRGQDLYPGRADMDTFLDLLKETVAMFNLKVFAYCLMPTHYHLLVQTPDANLSRCMRHINGVYTKPSSINAMVPCSGGAIKRSWLMLTATCWNWCQFTTTHFGGYCQKTGVWSSHRGYLFHDPDWEWL